MAFTIWRTTKTLPGTSGYVPLRYDLSTGGQEIADALMGLGESAFKLAQNYDNIQAETQLSTSKRLANEEMNRLAFSFTTNRDPDSYQDELQRSFTAIQRMMPMNKRAAREYKMWLNYKMPLWSEAVAGKQLETQRDNWQSEMWLRQASAEIAQDAGGFDEFLAAGIKEGLIDKSTAAKILSQTRISAQYNRGINYLEAEPEAFLKKIDDPDYLPRLDAQAKSALKKRARTEMGIKLAHAREALEAVTNAEQARLMNIGREGRLSNRIIRESKLPEFGIGSKDTFYKMLDAQGEAEIEKKESPYLKSDPTVKASILNMIRDPKVEVTINDISGLMGRGLSINDATSLINDLDVYKGFWFRRADSYLKGQLGWSDALTRFAHPEGGLAYSLAMDELFDSIEKEKLRGRDLLDRAMQISIPHLVDYWENVLMYKGEQLERLKKMLGAKTITGRPKKEETPKGGIDPKGIFE